MAGGPPETEQAAVVPAIATASSTAAVRSLGRAGVETVVAASDENAPALRSQYCDESVVVPDPTTDLEGYAAALQDLARRPAVGTILPFREPDVYALARSKADFADSVGTPWPDLSTLRKVQDRDRLFAAARRAGVDTPETGLADDWEDWDRPAVVKPRYTMCVPEYDDQFRTPSVQRSSTQYLPPEADPDLAGLIEEFGHVPLVQSYVPTTDEYALFAQYDHGEAVATFQHRQIRGWKYAGGPSAYRESVAIPELERAGVALLDELDWHGVAMVEFLRHPDTGRFELMEVNPRFWSSLPFTVQAGVDFPRRYWAQATGTALPTDPDYAVDIGGHLLWGELLHLHSVLAEEYPLVERPSFPRRALEIAASLARERRFDYLSRDDPRPFLRDLRNNLSAVGAGRDAGQTPGDRATLRRVVRDLLPGGER
ncbi:MAG: carboxylate--amine ligase [Haloarculaceae archaeon]